MSEMFPHSKPDGLTDALDATMFEEAESDRGDERWRQSWFAPTIKPASIEGVDEGGEPFDLHFDRNTSTSLSTFEPDYQFGCPPRNLVTLSEDEPVNCTVRPESFVTNGHRAVTPFEVVSDLRETLAQHVYLDGLRPWLRETGEGAKGGVSRIHFLHDEILHRPVAMKALDGNRGRPVQELGLLKEAIITGQLTHPGIPPVYDLWMSPSGECRFSMKKIDGRTLSDIVKQAPPGKRTVAQLESQLQIVIRVCDALSFAHYRGVLHRDVKPSNVMAGDHGEVFLMDWGCAYVHRDSTFERRIHLPRPLTEALKSQEDAIVGTPSFMAPEQVYGTSEGLKPATDVYLLGGLLYFVLTGLAPRAMLPSAREAIKSALDGFVHNPFAAAPHAELPAKLMEIARKALDPIPAARYQTAQAFQEALRDVLRDGMWLGSVCASDGETIYTQGDEADAVYMVSRGAVQMYTLERGIKRNVKTLVEGEVFGEAAFYTDGLRDQSVQAVGNTVLLRVPKKVFEQILYPGSCLEQIVRAIAVRQHGL